MSGSVEVAAPMTEEALQLLCASSPFVRFTGLQLIALTDQGARSTWRMPWRAEFERVDGSGQWQGGIIGALIDTAGCLGLIAANGGRAGTVDLRIDFLRPASGPYLDAVSLVRRVGRTLAVVDVEVASERGQLMAVGRGSFFVEQTS